MRHAKTETPFESNLAKLPGLYSLDTQRVTEEEMILSATDLLPVHALGAMTWLAIAGLPQASAVIEAMIAVEIVGATVEGQPFRINLVSAFYRSMLVCPEPDCESPYARVVARAIGLPQPIYGAKPGLYVGGQKFHEENLVTALGSDDTLDLLSTLFGKESGLDAAAFVHLETERTNDFRYLYGKLANARIVLVAEGHDGSLH